MRKFLAIFICSFIIFSLIDVFLIQADDLYEGGLFVPVISEKVLPSAKTQPPKVDATAAIVMDMESGRVLYEKNAYIKKPMASTTKIMTAVVALENSSLDNVVTVSKRAASVWGSTIDLSTGQQYKMKELLYGLLLNSGNDAAIAIAEHVGGTVEDFLVMMNRKAVELGALNTNYKSPHGLDMPDHYSTAYDLALITRYALRNKTFSQIVGTVKATIPNKNLYNTNEMLGFYPGADGVKTGYTGQAGRCLVTSATRNGMRLISVVLNAPTRTKRAESSKNMLDYGFNNYQIYNLLKADQEIKKIRVSKGVEDCVGVQAESSVNYALRSDEVDKIERRVTLPDTLTAPVPGGIKVGELELVLNGEVIARSALKTSGDVARKSIMDYFEDIIRNWGRLLRPGK